MRHHYVPQFLLRQWSKSSKDGKVETFRLDLPRMPSSRRGTRFIAYEDDLYALTKASVAGMERQAVEKQLLREIDNSASIVLRRMANSGINSLSHHDRVDWARFLMSLRLRQPEIVQNLRTEASEQLSMSLSENPEEYTELATAEDVPTLQEWAEDYFPGLVENFGMSMFAELVDNEVVGNKLLSMKWWLWNFSGQKHDLLLSDHPCIFTKGIDDPNLVIALPIGPRKVFMATKTERVAAIMRSQNPKDLLVRMNESSISQARIRIFALDGSQRRFIANRNNA